MSAALRSSPPIAEDVRRGLTSQPRTLPSYLLYDATGSALYEEITRLPEYYLTRAEHEIFDARGKDIVRRVQALLTSPFEVVELGAGSATKTELLLHEIVRGQGRCRYVPIDVSEEPVHSCMKRFRSSLPGVEVKPLVMTHERALRVLRGATLPQLVMFIGSSIANFEDEEASALLGGVRQAFGERAALLLGTDLRKSPAVMVPAYDDAAGVTAAFNLNLLRRINRELGGHFHLDQFRHVARWNAGASRMEMHLESNIRQDVAIDELGLRSTFEAGETIHTESSIKYDLPRVERLLGRAGFELDTTYFDAERRFALHLARAAAHG